MKTIFISILILFTTTITWSQQESELNSISLSVILPDNSEYLAASSISKLESKIQQIVTKNGISGVGYSNEFLIYPKFEIMNESVVTGMRNLVSIEADFNLFISQYSTKKVFASYSKSISGSGFNKQKAIVNAISNISTSDPELVRFIQNGKDKVLAYYTATCDQMIKDAQKLISIKQCAQAIALLNSIPKEAADCYDRAQESTVVAYQAYQVQVCETNILKAKTLIAANNYSGALRSLQYIDPSSSCASEAEQLINSLATKVDANDKKQWDFMAKRYQDNQDLKKYQLDIIKEISKAYYQSKPQTVIYKSLF